MQQIMRSDLEAAYSKAARRGDLGILLAPYRAKTASQDLAPNQKRVGPNPFTTTTACPSLSPKTGSACVLPRGHSQFHRNAIGVPWCEIGCRVA